MKNESGRTMVEIVSVLSIMGILSVVGIWGYQVSIRRKNIDDILTTLSSKTIEINSALTNQKVENKEELNDFLKKYTTRVGNYQLTFRASPDSEGGFVSDVTNVDGSKIKGAFCRELIKKMSEQQFVSDVDFTLKNEEKEDGTLEDLTVRLNDRYVDLTSVCGG